MTRTHLERCPRLIMKPPAALQPGMTALALTLVEMQQIVGRPWSFGSCSEVPDDGKRVRRKNECRQRNPNRNGEFGCHEPTFNFQRRIGVRAPENRNEQEPNAILHQEQ